MLSDAALALALGGEIKWLYNSARRLGRPVRRSVEDAAWWRLVHHLAVGLGVALADAARSADTLLNAGMTLGRVRLRATRDESVSISIDLARFHDGAALALACALHVAVPRARGRPRTRSEPSSAFAFSAMEMETVVRRRAMPEPERLDLAISVMTPDAETEHAGHTVVHALSAAAVPFALIGNSAALFHCAPWAPESVDLCADTSVRSGAVLASVLNDLGARPRGVASREAFRFDSALLRASSMLALRVGRLPLNVSPSIDGVGDYAQIEDLCVQVPLEADRIRVIPLDALLRGVPPARSAADQIPHARWAQLRMLLESHTGTR